MPAPWCLVLHGSVLLFGRFSRFLCEMTSIQHSDWPDSPKSGDYDAEATASHVFNALVGEQADAGTIVCETSVLAQMSKTS